MHHIYETAHRTLAQKCKGSCSSVLTLNGYENYVP